MEKRVCGREKRVSEVFKVSHRIHSKSKKLKTNTAMQYFAMAGPQQDQNKLDRENQHNKKQLVMTVQYKKS